MANYHVLRNRQLEDKCRELGIEPIYSADGKSLNRSMTIDAIRLADGEVVAADAEAKVENPAVSEVEAEPKEKTVRVIFHAQEGANNTPYVFIGVNGRSFYIPREVEYDLPEAALNVIKDAVEIVVEQRKDQSGAPYLVEKRVPRFAYSVVG